MHKKILCVAALDGQSSNHVMNVNYLKSISSLGYALDAIVINNYPDDDRCHEKCRELFDRYYLINGKSFDYTLKSFFKNVFGKNSFEKQILSEHIDRIEFLDEEYDRIISFSSPVHAHIISKAVVEKTGYDKQKYYQFWSDPVFGSMLDRYKVFPIKRLPLYLIEKRVIKNAGRNIYGSRPLYEFEKTVFKKEKSLKYVNIPCFAEVDQSRGKIPYTVGFFGTYPRAIRNVEPFVKAVSSMPESFRAVIVGDGDDIHAVSENVELIRKRIPYEEAHKLELDCDILISIGNRKGCQVPGKTFYYAGLNKPVIFISEGEFAGSHESYLRIFDRYILCGNTQEEIRRALEAAFNEIQNNKEYEVPFLMQPSVIAESLLMGGIDE